MSFFFSYTDRPMQCEVEIQQADRRHCDICGSWGPYTMEVEKGRNMSQIGGDGWARFLARMRLTGGELIRFSFRAEIGRASCRERV